MAQTGDGYGTAVSAASGTALSALETICQYHGWQDRTTAGEAQLDNFINHTIQLLATLAPWPEYNRVDGAQSFNRSTATITGITGDGSTVTVTAVAHGFSTGDVGDVTGTTNYNTANKKITVSDADTFTYTGDCQATAETSGTFTIGDQKTLAESSIVRLGNVIRADYSQPLEEIEHEEWLWNKRYEASTGPPTQYALRKWASSGLPKMDMLVYPMPTTSIMLYFTYQVAPNTLTNNSDTTDWPNDRIWLLTEALRTRLNANDKDASGMALHSSEFMTKVNLAMSHARPSFMPVVAKPVVMGKPGKWSIQQVGRHNMTVTS